MNQSKFNNQGVTLIELLIALLLFAILAAGVGYTIHMVVPNQRISHSNAINNDMYKLAYLFKADLLNTTAVLTPASPTGSIPSSTLALSVSRPSGLQHVEYRSNGTNPVQIQRCVKPDSSGTAVCNNNEFEDVFSEWNNGYVSLTGNGSGYTRGLDADANGSFSDREKNIIRIVLVMGQFEGASGSEAEVSRRTFVLEILPGGLTPGRTPI